MTPTKAPRKVIETLRQYANTENWTSRDGHPDDIQDRFTGANRFQDSGCKLAQEVLAAIEEADPSKQSRL